MKRARYLTLLGAWTALATILLAHFWLLRPDLFPTVPSPLALWLVNLYGSSNGEELADLEDLFALIASFMVVAVFTTAILLAARRYVMTRQQENQPRG